MEALKLERPYTIPELARMFPDWSVWRLRRWLIAKDAESRAAGEPTVFEHVRPYRVTLAAIRRVAPDMLSDDVSETKTELEALRAAVTALTERVGVLEGLVVP